MSRLFFAVCITLITSVAVVGETPSDSGDVHHAITVDSTEFPGWPIRGVYDALAIQPSVIIHNPNPATGDGVHSPLFTPGAERVHIRGGQFYENAFYVNGVHAVDPLTGRFSLSPANIGIQRLALLPGTRPVGRDYANAGLVDITTAGGDEYTGTIEGVSDDIIGTDYGRNWYSARLSGPIPFLNKGGLSIAAERRDHADRAPKANVDEPLPANWLEGWSVDGVISLPLTDKLSFRATGDYAYDHWSRFQSPYLFNLAHTPYIEDENLALRGELTHRTSDRLTLSFGASYFSNSYFQGDGVHRKDLLAYGRPQGNPGTALSRLFWSFDRPDTEATLDTFWVVTDTNAAGQPTDSIRQLLPDLADEAHVFSRYTKSEAAYFALDAQASLDIHPDHQPTIGGEYRRYTVRFYDHYFPTGSWRGLDGNGFLDIERYGYDILAEETDTDNWRQEAKNPTVLSGWIHDRIERTDFVISLALRADLFDYNTLTPRNPEQPLDPDSLRQDGDPSNDLKIATLEREEMEDADAFFRLSPQLDFTFAANEWIRLHGNFRVSHQMPPLRTVFSDWNFFAYKLRTGGYFTVHGLGDLEPIKTTAYSFGISAHVNNVLDASLNLYQRQSSNLPRIQTIPNFPTSYATYLSVGQADAQGAELYAKYRVSPFLTLHAGYRVSEVTGDIDDYDATIAWTHSTEAEEDHPLSHDRTHRLLGVIDLRFADGEGPQLGDWYPLENARASVVGTYSSGLPFTGVAMENVITLSPFSHDPLTEINAERMPAVWQIDLQLERTVYIGSLQITPFLWIVNLFDRDNVNDVWRTSGEASTTGWLLTEQGQDFISNPDPHDFTGLNAEQMYKLRENDPRNYQEPRQVYFGIRASF